MLASHSRDSGSIPGQFTLDYLRTQSPVTCLLPSTSVSAYWHMYLLPLNRPDEPASYRNLGPRTGVLLLTRHLARLRTAGKLRSDIRHNYWSLSRRFKLHAAISHTEMPSMKSQNKEVNFLLPNFDAVGSNACDTYTGDAWFESRPGHKTTLTHSLQASAGRVPLSRPRQLFSTF